MSGSHPAQPFIPAWLDDSKLNPVDFRVFGHLCRRESCFSSADTIAEVCLIRRATVFASLRRLEARGLIAREARAGKTTLIRPVAPTGTGGNEAEAVAKGDPVPDSARVEHTTPDPVPDSSLDPVPDTTRDPVPQPLQKGNPSKATHRRETITVPQGDLLDFGGENSAASKKGGKPVSPEGIEFARWFKILLPAGMNLPGNWENNFGNAFDELVRIDKRDPGTIKAVCEWARRDHFWQSNFFSPAKLRQRDKSQTQYFDVFLQKMPPQISGAAAPHHGRQDLRVDIGGRKHAGIYTDHLPPAYR